MNKELMGKGETDLHAFTLVSTKVQKPFVAHRFIMLCFLLIVVVYCTCTVYIRYISYNSVIEA